MTEINQIRISQRTDDLSNWISVNPILNNGELAVVNDENGNKSFKIGDGTSRFEDLPFFNENEVKTDNLIAKDVTAKSVAQGFKAKATPLGFAAGAFISANANFSQALGYNSETSAGHDYSFVWNGDDERTIGDYYESHGKGTFSLNPKNGISGLYIGESNLCTILDSQISSKAESEDLSAFYEKSQTSSSTQLVDEFQKYQLSGNYLSVSEFTYEDKVLIEED